MSKRFKGPYGHKTKEYFENGMKEAMSEGRRALKPLGLGVVVFAHKSTSGWEAQLQAMIDAGWIITVSWPIDTEMGSRMNAMGTASLASSIHLVCRPRENPDGSVRTDDVGEWRDVLHELPIRIHEWMPRLAAEGVVGADAIFACLGPALEIYSRYSRVENPNGEQVPCFESTLKKFGRKWHVKLIKVIFRDDADTSGFEEDARLTAMWLWTLSAWWRAEWCSDNLWCGRRRDSGMRGEKCRLKRSCKGWVHTRIRCCAEDCPRAWCSPGRDADAC